jgi:PAS domain S-box-containing protein
LTALTRFLILNRKQGSAFAGIGIKGGHLMSKHSSASRSIINQFRRHYLAASIIPIFFFLILILLVTVMTRSYLNALITKSTYDLNQDAERNLQQLGEKIIMTTAKDVARQIEMYFRMHPDKTFPEMRKDPLFMGLAIQKVGQTGYTALTEVNTWLFLVHPNAKLNDTDMRPLAKKMPDWWKIIEKAVATEATNSGYYNWREPDGSFRKKFMVVTPIGVKHKGITIWVSATTYIDEFTIPVQKMKLKADAIVASYQQYVFRQSIGFISIAALIILLTFAVIYLWGRRTGMRYIAPIAQLAETAKQLGEGKWEARPPDNVVQRQDEIGIMAQSFSHMAGQLKKTFSDLEQHIAELKQARDALKASEERYRGIIDNIVDVYYRTDRKGRLMMVSPSGINLLGYDSAADVMGREVGEYFYYSAEERKQFLSALEKNGSVRDFEVTLKDRNNNPITVSTSSRYYYDEKGKILGVEGIYRDIRGRKREEEERQKLERQLSQSQKMEAIGTLAGGIAHDFNNILSGIMGYTELSLHAVKDRPQAHNFMEQILTATERAKALVQQILTLSRKTEPEKKPLSLVPIVKEVVKFMRASLPTTIEIKQTIDETAHAVMADPTQIHQVLVNLCTNAGHAMKETGGVLEVGLKEVVMDAASLALFPQLKPGRYGELSVSDTGHGISQANLQKIFDPYFTTKGIGEGTGLGLSVVHGIVQDHGGEIKVYSEEGMGTIFRIYIPLMENPSEDQAEERTAHEDMSPQGHGETILFIDDEKMVVDINRGFLEKLNYRIVPETDPALALETFKKDSRRFDMVITDKTMPHMTGFDVIQKIRDIRPDIPVILCSGFMEKEEMEKIKTLGVTQLLIKPIRISVLAKVIRDVLTKDPHDAQKV